VKTSFGETFIFGKIPAFQAIFVRKNFVPSPLHVVNHPVHLNVNQFSKEIRWLVRVGMLSQNECLVKNSLAVSCVKIHGCHGNPRCRRPCPQCLFFITAVPSQREAGACCHSRSFVLLYLSDSEFVLLLKTVDDFNHKTNDVSKRKIDYKV